jgi:hypothetical protein
MENTYPNVTEMDARSTRWTQSDCRYTWITPAAPTLYISHAAIKIHSDCQNSQGLMHNSVLPAHSLEIGMKFISYDISDKVAHPVMNSCARSPTVTNVSLPARDDQQQSDSGDVDCFRRK